jgi:hypothetical protein
MDKKSSIRILKVAQIYGAHARHGGICVGGLDGGIVAGRGS